MHNNYFYFIKLLLIVKRMLKFKKILGFYIFEVILFVSSLVLFLYTYSNILTKDFHYEFSVLFAFVLSITNGLYVILSKRELKLKYLIVITNMILILIFAICRELYEDYSLFDFDGVKWYIILVFPSVIISTLLSNCVDLFVVKNKYKTIIYFSIWSLSFIRAGFEAYYNPHIYFYSWQIGYFPGLAWDAELTISTLLISYRIAQILIAILLYLSCLELIKINGDFSFKLSKINILILIICLFLPIVLFNRDKLKLTQSFENIVKFLPDSINTLHATIYIDKSKTDSLNLWKAEWLTEFYIKEIIEKLELDEAKIIRPKIFIYNNSDLQKSLTGAGNSNFTKPWLGYINITTLGIGSVLKHELTHVLLAKYGSILGIAYNQGITEGAAMMVEDNYPERTLEEHTKNITKIHGDTLLPYIFKLGGFTNAKESLCYTLSGGFCKWLFEKYGSNKFKKLFSNENFEQTYNQTFNSLTNIYRREIGLAENVNDEIAMKYLYGGSSFFKQSKLRKIGILNYVGLKELQKGNFSLAYKNFSNSLQYGVTSNARTGIIKSLYGDKKYIELLDSVKNFKSDSNAYYLFSTLPETIDALWLLGDTTKALLYCDSINKIDLFSWLNLKGLLRKHFINNLDNYGIKYILTNLMNDSNKLILIKNEVKNSRNYTDSLILKLWMLNITKEKLPINVAIEFEKLLPEILKIDNNYASCIIVYLSSNIVETLLLKDYVRKEIKINKYDSIFGKLNRIKDIYSVKTIKYRKVRELEFLRFVNFLTSKM